MIAFTTLFLGLVAGLQQVEVAVGDNVASVEILLDSHSLGTLTGEPWILPCDLGAELAPQLLEAVAYDADQRELARAQQVINLPVPPVVVSFLVDTDVDTQQSVARLVWESRVGEVPRSISAWLDDQPLVVEDPRRIVLPPHDRSSFHLFTADLEFTDSISTQVIATFGGPHAGQVRTELTALPVVFEGKKRKTAPSIESMRGWFLEDGRPLEPFTIEKGRSEIIVVLGSTIEPEGGQDWRYHNTASVKEGQSVRFLEPVAKTSPGVGTTFSLYPISPEYDHRDAGLYRLLSLMEFEGQSKGELRLADAVAVAGLTVYERSRRRAVVLLAESGLPSGGDFSPEQSRRYLERLNVPFFLWTAEREAAVIEGWGQPVSVSSVGRVRAAFGKINKNLDRQWIVWFEGRHLPQNITLSDQAEGISLIAD